MNCNSLEEILPKVSYRWNSTSWDKFVKHPSYLAISKTDGWFTPAFCAGIMSSDVFDSISSLSETFTTKNINLSMPILEALIYATEFIE